MRNSYKQLIFLLLLSTRLISLCHAQESRQLKPMVLRNVPPIIDYITDEDQFTQVHIPDELRQRIASRTTAPTATFNVTYIGFQPGEQQAFQFAVDIWSNLLVSSVPINMTVQMSSSLSSGVLAATGWGSLRANFKNAQKINTWYVVAMAEKMAGVELSGPTEPDIVMSVGSTIDWYLGTDGNTPAGQHDLVSVALHEIAHGLGFTSQTLVTGGSGSYGNNVSGIPVVYTSKIQNGTGQNLVTDFTSPSALLGDALTSDSLFFKSFSFTSNLPRLYAPTVWNSGSSIAHLDEDTYPAGNVNSLMTPQIGTAESIHVPGIALQMLEDMGWIAMDIDHIRVKDMEDSLTAIPIVATIKGDNPVDTTAVTLHYTLSNFNNDTTLSMMPTGNPDEYSATIPAPGNSSTISYYISVADSAGRVFTNPGDVPTFFNQFVVAPDTIAPVISHEPLALVFEHNLIATIDANVVENIGVTDLVLTYRVNGGATDTLHVPLVSVSNDGFYSGDYKLDWDLSTLGVAKGDSVEYRLDISDLASTPNSVVVPSTGFYTIQIDAINPAVVKYQNDFNVATNDFIGSGFRIGPEAGFDSDAIQSDHPYRTVDGVSPDDTLILDYILKTPIIISPLDATIRFDEVVLVEPGDNNSIFGDADFWDYVIVEGSKDNGVTWQRFEAGYDSRDHTNWLDQWNSAIVGQNSDAVGNKDLFHPRTINMSKSKLFNVGDTVLIRFKLYADQLAVGWGWAIDNLKIQIDDIPPVIDHIPPDFLSVGDTKVDLLAKVTDNASVDSVTFEVNLNGQTNFINFQGPGGIYNTSVSLPAITSTDVFKYRIIAVDSSDTPNTTFLPVNGFFEVPVAVLGNARTSYISDFNSTNNDFVGLNFNISQPTGFNDPAINSAHPYPDSPDSVRSMYYMLTFPITLNTNSAWVSYDEIGLVESNTDELSFEVSKDAGATWVAAAGPYSASANGTWNNTFNQKDENGNSLGIGDPSMLKNRFFNILDANGISGGDQVLVRFRMDVTSGGHGWGWWIDNLEIQGPTTAVSIEEIPELSIFPNPVDQGVLFVNGKIKGTTNARLDLVDLTGQTVARYDLSILGQSINEQILLGPIKTGMYIVRITTDRQVISSRIIIR